MNAKGLKTKRRRADTIIRIAVCDDGESAVLMHGRIAEESLRQCGVAGAGAAAFQRIHMVS